MTTRTGKALQKSHREKKSGSGHDQWVERKRARNAVRKQTWHPVLGWQYARA